MFIGELDVRAYRGHDDEWVVLSDMWWRDAAFAVALGAPELAEIKVPRGFVTDLASIPRPLRGLLDVNGPSRRAAPLHDYLYCSQPCLRAQADALFHFALATEGVGLIDRNIYYAGVRGGGWYYWNKRLRDPHLRAEDFVPPGYWEAGA